VASLASALITSISLKCLQSCQFRKSCRLRQCRQYASEVGGTPSFLVHTRKQREIGSLGRCYQLDEDWCSMIRWR
jgi:hypothetical protein